MRLLVTGHKGYIGSHVVKSFQDTPGVQIRGLERPRQGRESDEAFSPEHAFRDFDPTHVVHCGGIRDSNYDKPDILKWNTDSTNHLASLANFYGAHFVFLSTNLAGHRESFYGWSKYLSERYLLDAFPSDASICILRLQGVWGLEGVSEPDDRSVPTQILERRLRYVFDIERDYIHIDDVISAIHLAFAERGGPYAVGTGEMQKPLDLCRDIGYDGFIQATPEKILGRSIPFTTVVAGNDEERLPGFVPVSFAERWRLAKEERFRMEGTPQHDPEYRYWGQEAAHG